MSTARRRILVVSDTLALANNLLMWLNDAGHDPEIVTTFRAAKEHLRTAPDILITELKLREYNGFHLALRAHREGIPTAVIGADSRYADDAREIGTRYILGDNVQRDDIVLLVDGLLSMPAIPDPEGRGWARPGSPGAAPHECPATAWQIETTSDERRVADPLPARLFIH